MHATFQSTLPRGSDLILFEIHLNDSISIHAPSRERRCTALCSDQANLFQSTLPRGSDTLPRLLSWHWNNFNPRSLAGATVKSCLIYVTSVISIHAPSRERRLNSFPLWPWCKFQSTLPRGSDLRRNISGTGCLRFQSTLPRGSDYYYFAYA